MEPFGLFCASLPDLLYILLRLLQEEKGVSCNFVIYVNADTLQ
jgi:hypothetical protein